MAKNGNGRPSTLTQPVWDHIIEAIGEGHSLASAAAVSGISAFTVYGWVQRGEDRHSTLGPTERFAQFAHDVAHAREAAEGSALQTILDASAKDWRAAEAWLKLTNPRKYAQRVAVELDDLRRAADRVAEEHGVEAGGGALLQRANEIAEAAGAAKL